MKDTIATQGQNAPLAGMSSDEFEQRKAAEAFRAVSRPDIAEVLEAALKEDTAPRSSPTETAS